MNKRTLGNEKEQLAAAFLEEKGFRVIEKNFFSRYGEIDLIARHEGYLVFIEVKYRTKNAFGYPVEAVTSKKRQAMWKSASYYLYKEKLPTDTPCRFDVVSILGEKITWIKHCMEG